MGVISWADKIQALGRESRRGRRAGACCKHLGHPPWGLFALADGYQATHDVAHHVVQKRAGFEFESPVGAVAADVDVVVELIGGAEGAKWLAAFKRYVETPQAMLL